MMDDDAILRLVTRLSRQHASGGGVIERSALLAAGSDFAAILAWIVAHNGEPEMAAPAVSGAGLHGSRLTGGGGRGSSTPQRYVLPPGVLS